MDRFTRLPRGVSGTRHKRNVFVFAHETAVEMNHLTGRPRWQPVFLSQGRQRLCVTADLDFQNAAAADSLGVPQTPAP